MTIMGKDKGVTCFTKEVDEVAIMSRRNVGETRMGCVNICCYCSFQEWPQRRTIIGQWLHSPSTPSAAAAAVMMVMVVVFSSFCSAATTRRVGA